MPSKAVKLGKIVSISTEVLRKEAAFTEKNAKSAELQTSVRKNYEGHFVNVCRLEKVEDMLSSNFLRAKSIATNVCYIKVGRMMMKNKGVFPSLEKLGKDRPATKTLSITYLDNLDLYVSSEKDIYLMI